MTPTPQQLALSLTDTGQGLTAEVASLGRTPHPDPQLGHHIITMARRLANRVVANDLRLAAFQAHTDPSGYTWIPEDAHQYLREAAQQNWSFERWFTGLADTMLRCDPPSADLLDQLASEGDTIDELRDAGYRPVVADPSGFVFKREERS